jgi:hypothetical protein
MSQDSGPILVSRRRRLISLRILLPLLLVAMFVSRSANAGTIDTLRNFDSQLAASGSLVSGGTFVADASKLAEFTLILFAQDGTLGRAVVLATSGGVPVGTPLWQGPDVRWPLGLPLRADGSLELTYQPNLPLVAGETYFVGMDFGLFGAGFQNQIFFVGAALSSDPIPGGRAWAYIDGGGWFPPGTPGTDIAARIVMGTRSPRELLSELVSRVIQLNLSKGISNSLDAKLNAVMAALDDTQTGNDTAAINVMFAFINSVEAQRGKGLTTSQADSLVSAAQQIISALGG